MLRETPVYLLTAGQPVKGSSPLDHHTTKGRFLVYATVKDLSVDKAEVVFRGAYTDMKVVKIDGRYKADQIELTDYTGKTLAYDIKTTRYHRNKTIFYIYRNKAAAIG